MFEVHTTTSLNYRYSINRLNVPNLQQKICLWIQKLKSISPFGPLTNWHTEGHVQRKHRVNNFRKRFIFTPIFSINAVKNSEEYLSEQIS